MNKIKVKGIPFKLVGEIKEQGHLSFKGIDRDGDEVSIDDIKGTKVISVFPKLNTSVCDAQTVKLSQWATSYKGIKFISMTNDNLETINKWCADKEIDNLDIWSDHTLGEFAFCTNALISKMKVLNRGLLILDDKNEIVNAYWNAELSADPEFDKVEEYINSI